MKKLWNRDFILMLQGNAVSGLGDLLYGVAIGYWVYEKTGAPFWDSPQERCCP